MIRRPIKRGTAARLGLRRRPPMPRGVVTIARSGLTYQSLERDIIFGRKMQQRGYQVMIERPGREPQELDRWLRDGNLLGASVQHARLDLVAR